MAYLELVKGSKDEEKLNKVINYAKDLVENKIK